ncbi:uncharacterized protein K452DRAFT_285547 [Aplosporella prunicola CBS 121167]|uniref:Uncharacterized protein n=1 Tax=Aplosporella prunicola CBS 121167 TaxID=1176127 RepID=A0A6A6BJF6_9PEZI|nr:uncharacterized protein K452DRAFT_285547 [Aplosporella prunicola CBS 121167]KAF2144300.1 hypothetical protein K452DRAFT_285547 [Aplosporella prunicola CBS 121167]
MRAFVSGWTGRRLGLANFTQAGDANAKELVELFDRAGTLAEFNSGTYAGVSLHALALWARYMPSDSVMGKNGARMLSRTWTSLAELYHAGLKNSAGPWDRTYGYDMNRYLSILGLHIWSLVGREASPIAEEPYAMSHSSDFAFAPLIAVMAVFHNSSVVPEGVIQRLKEFPGEHTVRTSAFSPPYDTYPRNISAWLSDSITIGAETFNETEVGGPSLSSDSFSPAVVQWDAGDANGVGWLKWYATEPSLIAKVSPGILNLTYPYGNHSSIFTFFVSTFVDRVDVTSWDDVQAGGLAVNVSGNANLTYEVSFNGQFGGAGETIKWVFFFRVAQ